MEQRANDAPDLKRHGHGQIALLLADLLARPVIVVFHNPNTGGEVVYGYAPGFTSFAGGFGANFPGVLLFPSFPLFLLLFAFYKKFYNLSAAQLDDLRLPNGDVNYIQLFQDNALPNPICVWYNGTNHYEPITLVCPFFILS